MMRVPLLVALILTGQVALAEHPRVLVQANERNEIRDKIRDHEWVRKAFGRMKKRVDLVVDEVEKEPDWLRSRLMMNWETNYVLAVTRKEKWIGGEGRAPVPTPRFAGARDWKSAYRMPSEYEDWKPYNSWADNIWMINRRSGEGEWVHPSRTGRTIELVNRNVMRLAAEAAFLYWLTNDERYAKVAAPVLWGYMEGFSHVKPPRVEDPESESERIIGMTSFEVIHEEILPAVSQCYDFIHGYLVKEGMDTELIQAGIKRMADRVIQGGLNKGNWNLFQAKIIAHGGLVLESNDHYADGKGREYYMNKVLNADLPGQRGLMKVVEEGFDSETALWPEAPSYGFETTESILDVANLISTDPMGHALIANPVLERALLAQAELTHPNGLSIGLGDTINSRLNSKALEMLIAGAREHGRDEQEIRLTGLLMKEIENKRYSRNRQDNIYALTNYVGKLRDVETPYGRLPRSYYGKPLNVQMMRLPGAKSQGGLSAAMFGTAGGHAQANGLAIELFGAGLVLGPDPGRGTSYWQRDHRHYYSRLPSHNTVIPNGDADYNPDPPKQLAMKLGAVEPAPGDPGLSDRIGFAQAEFRYKKPQVFQRRTLALVRTGEDTGFYFDVFRSRSRNQREERCHDYLYHGMGQGVVMTGGDGKGLSLEKGEMLGEQHGDLEGYDYFRNERYIETDGGFRARFELELPKFGSPVMDMWMTGGKGRRIFALEAPPNRAIRDGLPASVSKLAMPTVLARQDGEAWKRPFVVVYEPFVKKAGPLIRSVRPLAGDEGVDGVVVDGDKLRILLMESETSGVERAVEGFTFDGVFGAVIGAPGRVDEIYLGEGRLLGVPGLTIRAKGSGVISASLRRNSKGVWICNASGPVEFEANEDGGLPQLFR
ncbi:hypothetical protein [Haloferula sp.]|uniref:hypothetical protein n=1 Tax=Haloferula sp. TaxID=2497595 RepID=UPI00329F5D38